MLSEKLIERICERLAEGITLTDICKTEGMPTPTTVRNWQREHEWVATKIALAREVGFDAIAEDALRIADTIEVGEETLERETPEGKTSEVRKADMLQHRKLRVWTRLQLLAKWDPNRYGDRIQHANDPNNPLPAPQFIIQPTKPVERDDE
jgi:transcriptional regulator with XRE-family HTH domain